MYTDSPSASDADPDSIQPLASDDQALDAYSRTVVGVVEAIGPAVVSVHVGRRNESSVATGAGSGVIVTPDGYLLTNQHVVGRSTRVDITLISGETLEARVIAADASTDLAVLRARIPTL